VKAYRSGGIKWFWPFPLDVGYSILSELITNRPQMGSKDYCRIASHPRVPYPGSTIFFRPPSVGRLRFELTTTFLHSDRMRYGHSFEETFFGSSPSFSICFGTSLTRPSATFFADFGLNDLLRPFHTRSPSGLLVA
jgi:hypothetical protein